MTYSEKLKDPRWQKKRLHILGRDEFKCRLCNDDKTTLHVHHKYYKPDTDPWDYEDVDYITLCDPCHKKAHNRKFIVNTDISKPEWISCFAGGEEYYFLCPNCGGTNLHQQDKWIYHRSQEDSPTGLRIRISEIVYTEDDIMCMNPSSRRDGIEIYFSCETCDVISKLTIQQHKGTEFVSFVGHHRDAQTT